MLPPIGRVILAPYIKLVTQKFELKFAAAVTQPRKRLLTGSVNFRKYDVGRFGGLPLSKVVGFACMFD